MFKNFALKNEKRRAEVPPPPPPYCPIYERVFLNFPGFNFCLLARISDRKMSYITLVE